MNSSRGFCLAGIYAVFYMGTMLILSAPPAWAQATSTSSVTGQVTDQQNAAIPGAEVKLIDTATTSTLTTTTNEAGRYIFINVSPGIYDITISRSGFARAKVMGQKAEIGSTLTINVALEIGATTTVVEVLATAGAELQTSNAAVGTTLNNDALIHLPNLGRDVSTLAVLQPGVTPGGFTAGAYADQNTYTLDGGNNSDDMSGNYTTYTTNFTGTGGAQTNGNPSGVLPTPVESIEEFRVQTFNQTSDFNSSIGGNIQMVTKRGSNQFHGSGYGYYFATNLGAANTWTNNHTPAQGLPYTPLPSNHRNRFGGSIGGPLTPRIWGGKTYFFFNYEGSRFPNVAPYERTVPSLLMRAGVIQVPDASGKYIAYNLNPTPVTVNGVTYQPAACPAGSCDPRAIGLNPIVKQVWDKFMPLPNEFLNQGDLYNTQGYLSTIRAPLTSNSYVGRIDRDFGDKWRFFGSYRFLRLVNVTTNQVDIGGALPGGAFGQPAATAPRTQVPAYWVAGMTTNITPTVTNEFRFSYLRNFWQWGSSNAPPQLPGLGGAVEIGGESLNALIPYNVNTQNIRQRFWDGQDKLLRDDLSMIKGNHLFQFGGSYQRNYNFHMRTDNGQGINNQIVYQINNSGINFTNSPYIPTTVPSAQQPTYASLYSQVLGLVNQPQVAYTRAGDNLALQSVGSVAFDQSIIPYYNVYFSDTWHMKNTFTLTYGLSYGLEMPPYEINGKQVELVYQDGSLVDTEDYLAQRKKAALAGQVYNPVLAFATVPNVGKGLKYPYYPFYAGFSPRVSAAWNPSYDAGLLGKLFGRGKTVLRGGYGRIYGRLNGVNLVLVPLLGPGLLQAVGCNGASRTGQCLGTGNVDPSTAFRIGTDGLVAPLPAVPQTLGQPYIPGLPGNAPANDATVLDPRYKPERTDNFSFTLQREISSRNILEVGYIGRIIRNEFQEINLDAVPYMTTLNGQAFSQAWAYLYNAVANRGVNPANVQAQPFFEAALGGAGSAYCTGFTSCTAAVASKSTSLIRNSAVSDMWAALYKAPSWTLARSMVSAPLGPGLLSQGTAINTTTSLGYGNYHALFITHRMRDWHGLTATSNFTWGRALGTAALGQYNSSNTALDVWNMQANYGPQNFDIKFIYNAAIYWQPKYFKSQHGVLGHILGGWTISPLFTAQSGPGISPTFSEGSCTGCQAFGEVTPPASSGSTAENAVAAKPYTGGNSAQYGVAGANGAGTNNPTRVNMFSDPAAVLGQFRKCVLGIDTSCGGYYVLRGLPRWNLDAAVAKDISWREGRLGATLQFQFTNVLNHAVMANPALSITSPTTFGRITGQANTPRNMEFGLRIHF
jgi:hypothetical protein